MRRKGFHAPAIPEEPSNGCTYYSRPLVKTQGRRLHPSLEEFGGSGWTSAEEWEEREK